MTALNATALMELMGRTAYMQLQLLPPSTFQLGVLKPQPFSAWGVFCPHAGTSVRFVVTAVNRCAPLQ